MRIGQAKQMLLRFILALAVMSLSAPVAFAQTAVPTSRLAWDQVGQSVAVAQAAEYRLYLDAASSGTALAPVTCVAGISATTATCSVSWPAMTPGVHAIQLTQTIAMTESAKSVTFSATLVLLVTPTNVRIL